ncbi:membrane protein [Devosia limi DSM 17137]|uniref:Membrane protein n=1 Tax=Devosia limi DSM 17137 TaxID=1121477 RepID=A0A0F5L194_9HYPH|nr:DUF3817 domain-containing protein [Devosia limi]KKB76171.1 membrane protein [Devosia limi DSM 17137]SHF20462.1 integral membrane protein [Devosia limi DSM 17137]
MIRLFRFVGIVEGITTVALFFVAMPLKYWFAMPGLVPPVGMIHGAAFVVYLLAMVVCLWGRGFTAWEWTRTTFAAFFPLGTFLNDPMLRRKQLTEPALLA